MKILIGLIIIGLLIFQPKAEAYTYKSPKIKTIKIQPVYQYEQTRGYIKSNGTYVSPYIRGSSNSVKYDNRNYFYKDTSGRRVYPNR